MADWSIADLIEAMGFDIRFVKTLDPVEQRRKLADVLLLAESLPSLLDLWRRLDWHESRRSHRHPCRLASARFAGG